LGLLVGIIVTESYHNLSAEQERKQQMRLAALDRRLQTHQEAFSRLRWIQRDLNDRHKLSETVFECQDWWENNCLYLSPEAMQAFSRAYLNSSSFIDANESRDLHLMQLIQSDINHAREIIVKGVGLPPISQDNPIKK